MSLPCVSVADQVARIVSVVSVDVLEVWLEAGNLANIIMINNKANKK